MEQKNKFYISQENETMPFLIIKGGYDLETGEPISKENTNRINKHVITKRTAKVQIKVSESADIEDAEIVISVLKYNGDEYLGYDNYNASLTKALGLDFECSLESNVTSIAFMFNDVNLPVLDVAEYLIFEIHPHYKHIQKKSKKENNQMLFRESLDGKITLFGTDYELINNASLENSQSFKVYRNGALYASANFNKSDCKFNHSRKSVELKFTSDDNYSKILDAYDNTYDLIKLAPALSYVTLTKRLILQLYIKGESVISSYAGGTYWETEVMDSVDDENMLTNKYHFAKNKTFREINLEGFNYPINSVYKCIGNKNIWNAEEYDYSQEGGEFAFGSIVFVKEKSADEWYGNNYSNDVFLLSTGANPSDAVVQEFSPGGQPGGFRYRFDSYRIQIWTGPNGTGSMIYRSTNLYGKDSDFTIDINENRYRMEKVDQPIPAKIPTPESFNLGNFSTEYSLWARILCDVDYTGDGQQTYDLPRDDFAVERANYRKCIGLNIIDDGYIHIVQCSDLLEEPTAYGINDYKQYFRWPYTIENSHWFPIARSAWANTSLWVQFDMVAYDLLSKQFYKEYTIRDCYHIADAIKAILSKIDPSIKHDKTPEYSQFLYGHTGATAQALGGCDIYITQKTNVLKGEYDQAAQKAEVKLKQIMEMLRDCFRCYWFIDDQNRFRIEHIRFFTNGQSYYDPATQIDLTTKCDAFNKKAALYDQQTIEYEKNDLTARYEFSYADNSTKAMGGDLVLEVNNKFIQKDKTEKINVDNFSADVDYMLFMPDDFSKDGFALLLAQNGKVPIVEAELKEEKQNDALIKVYVQNWYASFNQLIKHYLLDMPGDNITYNNITENLEVGGQKKFMKHTISFPANRLNIDLYKTIKTELGIGYIDEASEDIDTGIIDIDLKYSLEREEDQ